jgi:hypothetical protein
MDYKNAEVTLTLRLRGAQAIRGCYSHYYKIDKEGKEINGTRVEKAPTFNDCKKTINLSNEFVNGALSEPPSELKHFYRIPQWRKLPERKRIQFHVNSYVVATHPEHRGYTMEIL